MLMTLSGGGGSFGPSPNDQRLAQAATTCLSEAITVPDLLFLPKSLIQFDVSVGKREQLGEILQKMETGYKKLYNL
jgi:hypothetical protein